MHEVAITKDILEGIKEQMVKAGIERLGRVRVQVGEMVAVKADSLQFCFHACTQGTSLEGAVLEVEEKPLTGRCRDCSEEFFMEGPLAYCVNCKGSSVDIVAGREIDIVSIEPYVASHTN